MKKNIIILLLSLLVLLTIASILIYSKKEPLEKKEILFVHGLSERETAALDKQIAHYQNINRYVTILSRSFHKDELFADSTALPHIFTWDGPFNGSEEMKISQPVSWTGDRWFLCINPDLFSQSQLEQLETGVTVDEFSRLLAQLKSRGIWPIALGNSHKWPLTIWEQHLELAYAPDDSEGRPDLDETFTEARELAWDSLRDWKEKEFFLDDIWKSGWAAGIGAVSGDRAAMVLMASNMISSIPAEKRESLSFLPFPLSSPSNPWVIGSGLNLMIRRDSDVEKESLMLLEYLTSQAVAEILSEDSGSLFHYSDESKKRTIPSWESLANTQKMREYGEALFQYVSQ